MTLNPVKQAFASISTDLLDSLKKYIECKQVRGSSLSGGSWPDKGRWDGGVMTEVQAGDRKSLAFPLPFPFVLPVAWIALHILLKSSSGKPSRPASPALLPETDDSWSQIFTIYG